MNFFYFSCSDAELCEKTAMPLDRQLSEGKKRIAQERFTLIAGVLPYIGEEGKRSKMINFCQRSRASSSPDNSFKNPTCRGMWDFLYISHTVNTKSNTIGIKPPSQQPLLTPRTKRMIYHQIQARGYPSAKYWNTIFPEKTPIQYVNSRRIRISDGCCYSIRNCKGPILFCQWTAQIILPSSCSECRSRHASPVPAR